MESTSTLSSPRPSFRKSNCSKIDYLYEVDYVSEDSKVPITQLPLLNPYKAFTKPNSTFPKVIRHVFNPNRVSAKELVMASQLEQHLIPATEAEQMIPLRLEEVMINQWRHHGYTHIHYGAIRLARIACRHLYISAPLISDFRIFWCPWLPSTHGNSCNVSINVSHFRSRFAAIIRDSHGSFVFALKITSSAKHFLKCLLHSISKIKIIGIRCVRIQASHEDITLLGRDYSVDWPLFQIKRRLTKDLSHMDIFRVSFFA